MGEMLDHLAQSGVLPSSPALSPCEGGGSSGFAVATPESVSNR